MTAVLMTLLMVGCAAAQHEDWVGSRPINPESCPESPNCVSAEAEDYRHKIDGFRLKGDFGKNWLEIRRVVGALPESTIDKADEIYLRATFRSRVFRFADIFECFLNPSTGMVSIRSAAQSGYWDFGVNRRRVERLRRALQAEDLIGHL